jgi:hypothetical protein
MEPADVDVLAAPPSLGVASRRKLLLLFPLKLLLLQGTLPVRLSKAFRGRPSNDRFESEL